MMTEEKLTGSVVWMIIKMDVKVADDDEFMRCGGGKRKERIEFIKTEKGLEKVEDEGGR